MIKNFLIKNQKLTFRGKNLIIFLIAFTLYLINKFILISLNSFFSNYFNDLLATLLLFSFINTISPIYLKKSVIIILITLIAIFFWEYLSLFLKPGSVFDWYDILAYLISMVIYLLILKFYLKIED
jgi:hypothetical protein